MVYQLCDRFTLTKYGAGCAFLYSFSLVISRSKSCNVALATWYCVICHSLQLWYWCCVLQLNNPRVKPSISKCAISTDYCNILILTKTNLYCMIFRCLILYHVFLVQGNGIEPFLPGPQPSVLPTITSPAEFYLCTHRLCWHTVQYMVPPVGIEPTSSVLQTGAMTTSAKAAYM